MRSIYSLESLNTSMVPKAILGPKVCFWARQQPTACGLATARETQAWRKLGRCTATTTNAGAPCPKTPFCHATCPQDAGHPASQFAFPRCAGAEKHTPSPEITNFSAGLKCWGGELRLSCHQSGPQQATLNSTGINERTPQSSPRPLEIRG